MRYVAVSALVMVAACSAGSTLPPSPAPPLHSSSAAPPPVVTIAPPAKGRDARRAGPEAVARIEAWKAKRKGKPKIDQVSRGAFIAVVARGEVPSYNEGAVATDEGLLDDVRWSEVISADEDADGDGREDLLLVEPSSRVHEDPQWDAQPLVIADRPGGPVRLPLKGTDEATWKISWAKEPRGAVLATTSAPDYGEGSKGWTVASNTPLALETAADRDGDGVPEIADAVASLPLAVCPKRAGDCDAVPLTAAPMGLVRYDAGSFDARTPKLRGAYAALSKKRSPEIARARASRKADACPTEVVEGAGELYLFARWAGKSEAEALAPADALMKDVGFKACAQRGAKPRDWPAVRKDMVKQMADALPR